MADSPQSTIAGNAPPSSRPDFERPEYKAGAAARALCQALMHGTDGVRALGEVGLPKWPAEQKDKYELRARMTKVVRYYQRTVEASVGMICSPPPALAKDTDPVLVADAEDIDGKGTHLEVFARHLTDDAITGGFTAVLVDAPPIPEGLSLTLADEQALGLRPFWVSITANQIISWVVDVPDWGALLRDWRQGLLTAEQVKSFAKQTVIRQVVIAEPTDVRDGDFGMTCVERFRVLALTDAGVTFAVWEKRKAEGAAGEHFVQIASGAMTQAKRAPFREIPLAIVYGGRKIAPFVAEPPLHALAELNLDHYQVSADRRYLMRLCHAPTFYLFGVEEEVDETGRKKPIEVGPNSAIISSNASAQVGYAAADPNALQSSKEEREELVRQMATLGMSFIGKDQRALAETATGRALDDAAENATHALVARGLQDGLEQAFRFHAMYRGVPAPSITVNTSYASADVDPQIATVIWAAVAADKMPVEVFTHYLKTGELPDDVEEQVAMLRLVTAQAALDDGALDASAPSQSAMQIEYDDTGKPVRLTPTARAA